MVDSYKTDETGQLIIKKLLPGKYEIIETSAPDGYLLDEEALVVTIDENGNLTINEKENVKLDDNGNINIINKLESQSIEPVDPKITEPPNTSDSSPVIVLIILVFISLGSSYIILKKKI